VEKGSPNEGAPSERNLIIGSRLLRGRSRSNIAGILGCISGTTERKKVLLAFATGMFRKQNTSR
jgi:hypothetical protein